MTLPIDAIQAAAVELGPHGLAAALGRPPSPRSSRHTALTRCFAHRDTHPSCSVTEKGGRIVWRCHSCGAAGDAITAFAAVHGLDPRRGFREAARGLGELLGVDCTEAPTTAPRVRPDPLRELARAIDAAADAHLAGRPIYDRDAQRIGAAPAHAIRQALHLLRIVDQQARERDAARDAELNRLADAYEARMTTRTEAA